MPKSPPFHLFCLLLTCLAGPALADIYKHVDADGRVTYTDLPLPGSRRILADEPGKSPVAPAAKAQRATGKRQSTPGHFPKVDPGTQRKRDDVRRQLLLDELKTEENLLRAARAPRPGGDPGKQSEEIRLHEKNIEMLNKELAHIK